LRAGKGGCRLQLLDRVIELPSKRREMNEAANDRVGSIGAAFF
jgi:hypothetical protein